MYLGMNVGILWSYVVQKTEYPEETNNLGWATTTMPYADAENRLWAAKMTSEGFTPVLSKLFSFIIRNTRKRSQTQF